MSTSDPVVIASAVRTPLGRFQGELAPLGGGGEATAIAIEIPKH